MIRTRHKESSSERIDKVAGVMDMLEEEFHVLTAIEKGKVIGGGSGSGGGGYGSGGSYGSGGGMSFSDPTLLHHTTGTNLVLGEFAGGSSSDPEAISGSYKYEADVNTYYDPDTGQYSLNVGAHILTYGGGIYKNE